MPAGSARAQGYMFGRASFALGSQGQGPASVVAGDFNADGRVDLAVVQSSRNDVAVLLGKADGTLAPAVYYPTGPKPVAVVVADFNGDGRQDLAIANQNCASSFYCGADGSVSILLGGGDGTFQPPMVSATVTQPTSIAVGDLNGDGRADLVVANGALNSILVLLGNGNGTFQPPVPYGTSGGAESVALGDFNGDGKIDVAVATSFGAVSIFLGVGDGSLHPAFDLPTLAGANALIVDDFNSDSLPDLAVTYGQQDAVSILLGNGDGTFQPRLDFATESYPTAIAAKDLNGDEWCDLVVVNSNQTFSILLGNGDGTLQTVQTFALPGVPTAVTVQDFNRDGKPDLAIVMSWLGTVSLIIGRGDGTFPTPQAYGGLLGSWAIAAGDFTGDGKLDLVTTNLNDNSISLFSGLGDGTFDLGTASTAGLVPVAAVAGDFNRDGRLDLAVVNQTCTALPCARGSVSVMLGNGNGTFLPRVDYTVGNIPVSVITADLNGDGIPDLAVVNNGFGTGNTVSLLFGQNDSTFSNGGTLQSGIAPKSVVALDFSGSGTLGLAVAHSGGISIVPGLGGGIFGPKTEYRIVNGAKAIAAGDFNRDGKTDLAVSTPTSVVILLGNGDGTFQWGESYPVDSFIDLSSIVVGDFNGDGQPDLMVGKSNNAVSILVGNGDGTFQPGVDIPVGKSERGWVEGDFDGDGGLDLASASVGPDAVFVALNTPVVALFPSGLDFGGQGEQTTSAPSTLTISNPSGAPLAISGVSVSGAFAMTNPCPSTLAPGSNCALSISFAPTTVGDARGMLTISDSAMSGPQNVPLHGIGMGEPAATVSPISLSFTPQNVGTTSSGATVTLVNSGGAALSVGSITTTGDFAESNTCVPVVAAGGQCTIMVTFTPMAAGTRTGVLTLNDSAPSSPQVVNLSGTGVAEPVAVLSTSSLAFGNERVNTTSSPQTLTLSNSGNAPLQITSVAATSGFFVTHNCPASLDIGSTYTISVSFAPAAGGTMVGSVIITDNAADSPQVIALTGTGTAPMVSVAPSSMSFANQVVGSASSSQSLTLSNPGSATLSIAGVSVSGPNAGDFSLQNQCGASLAAGTSCGMLVSFNPAAPGTRTASLNVSSNAGGTPQSVTLTGAATDFSFGSSSGSATQVSVTPGQQALFYLTIAPEGMQTNVSFSCVGAPADSTCQVPPGAATLDGVTPVGVTVSIQTTAPSRTMVRVPQMPRGWGGSPVLTMFIALACIALMGLAQVTSRRRTAWGLATLAVSAMLLAGCGGGGQVSVTPHTTQPGTPAGTYALTVTANASGRSHTTTLTLTVQN